MIQIFKTCLFQIIWYQALQKSYRRVVQTLGQIYFSQFYLVINCKITLRNDLRNVGQIFWPINTFNSNENLSAVSKLNIPYHNQYLVKSRFLFHLDNFWGLIWNQIKPLLDTFNLFFLLEDYIAHFSVQVTAIREKNLFLYTSDPHWQR